MLAATHPEYSGHIEYKTEGFAHIQRLKCPPIALQRYQIKNINILIILTFRLSITAIYIPVLKTDISETGMIIHYLLFTIQKHLL